MVASLSGSRVDKAEHNTATGVAEEGAGAQTCEDVGTFHLPVNSRGGKASEGRESGLVVRLFPNPPQIFGASQARQLGRDNDNYRDSAENLAELELLPLEAEALSLSRMLKSLEPQEFTFATSGVPSPPSTPGKYSSRPTPSMGGEGFEGLDDFMLPRSPKGPQLQVERDKNDPMHSFNAGDYANTLFSPTKSPKSRRRNPGAFGLGSSRGSTPSSSIGSAAELHFPVVTQSPSSPEPLRPLSPLKWRPKVSPVEDTSVRDGVRGTPVQGLVARNPSYAEYCPASASTKLMLEDVKRFSSPSEKPRSDPELSAVVEKLKQQGYGNSDSDDFTLRSGIPPGVDFDPDRIDYSFAMVYRGPPISHELPKVTPLELNAVAPDAEDLPSSRAAVPPSPVRDSAPSSSKIGLPMLSVPFTSTGLNNTLLNSTSLALDAASDSGSSMPSPRLTRPPRYGADYLNRPINSELPKIGLEQEKHLVQPTSSSSPDTGSQADVQEHRIYPDNESNFVSKGYSLPSRSFRAEAELETLTPSKSVPEFYKMQATDNTGAGSVRQHGQRPRSASMHGIEPRGSGGSSKINGHHSSSYGGPDIPAQQRRKGECWSCRKGNWLTDKESCLVCNAKYCYNCVLTAMESMPEGRKCKHCIGERVDDSRRASIGRPSRLLNRLLSPQEVQQIMKAEKECAANQLKPDQLWVNGRRLKVEELSTLLGCPNPPQKLKPGRYWYDPQSGLWGKEGERPDKLITHGLRVGGPLEEKASNGNTQVYMNNRELGKLELKMLKIAGVHCPPKTLLWVDSDGSYREVGTKNSKGNIWKKTSIKLLYPFFSLPTPSQSARASKEGQRDYPDVYLPDYVTQNKLQKILLLGHEGSGRSTIFKQTKFLFKEGFEHDERQKMKAMIQSNIFRYASILLEGRERFEEDDDLEETESRGKREYQGVRRNIYTLDSRLKEQADQFLEMLAEGNLETLSPSSRRKYASFVDHLWKHSAIKATFQRNDELNALPIYLDYFLDKVMDVTNNEYVPSDVDILRAEGLAQGSGLAEVEFSLDEKLPSPDVESSSPVRYQLIKVGAKGMAEGCKWLDMFEDVHAVIFCVAISEYDQVSVDNDGTLRSKLRQTELFESVLKHPVLRDKPFVLLLNKYDLFEDKFCKGIPLTICEWFTDFKPVGASQTTPQMQAQQAYTYVVHKYKELFSTCGHKVFTFKLMATEQDKVLEAFQYVREILKWKDNSGYDFIEDSSYSTDLSSYSQHLYSGGPDGYYDDRTGNNSLEL